MNGSKVFKNTIRRILPAAVLIAVTVFGAFPKTATAAPPPLDLTFNNSITTPLIVNNIKPGDHGTKVVTLTNAGTSDGIATIWLSDVVNGEGLNPEPETGDTSGPGELGDYLTLDVAVTGLSTNIQMPVSINNFPESATSEKYVEILPFKAGETKTISLNWELPASTGNNVQGDELSFTINYLLQQTTVTELPADTITPTGNVTKDVTVYSETKQGKVLIKANTVAKTATNQTPTEIWIVEIDNTPPAVPAGEKKVGKYYDAGPDGTTFSEPLIITLYYEHSQIPEGISEQDLFIALWNETTQKWEKLPGCVVNTVANTISAPISHFSRYSVLCPDNGNPPPTQPTQPATPPPASVPPSTGTTTPPPAVEEEKNEVQVNLLDGENIVETGQDGSISDGLTLKDPDGNFFIEVKAGAKITDSDGNPLSRIELDTVDRNFTLPDGTVLLTPVYQLTGYDENGDVTDIVFDPPAIVSLHYTADSLPEYSFIPYLATWSDEEGLTALDEPFNMLVALGWTQGLAYSGGLFFAVTTSAAPQLPLPANFIASNLVINPLEISEGDNARISVTVSNEGEEAGSYEIYLIIDGIVRAIRQVDLDPNTSEISTFEISNLAAGVHNVEIAHLEGSLTVKQVENNPMIGEVNWPVIDITVGTAVVLGLVIWFFVMRRVRRRERISRHLA